MRTCLLLMASLAGSLLLGASASPVAAAPAIAAAGAVRPMVGAHVTRAGHDDWDDDDDYYDDDDDEYIVAPRGYPPPYAYAPPPAVVGAPPFVYGWPPLPPPRPASCGQYRYWNGEFCADARFRPPYIGPRY